MDDEIKKQAARERASTWYYANKCRALAAGKDWAARNSEKSAEIKHAYYERNKEKIKASTNKWKASNREAARASAAKTSRKWRRENPDMVITQKKAYLARKRAAGKLLPETIREVFKAFDQCCAYCGDPKKLTLDHLHPIIRGGTNDQFNLVAACWSCNSSKQDKHWMTWYKAQEFFDQARMGKLLAWFDIYIEDIDCN
jgi:hypothetical protein